MLSDEKGFRDIIFYFFYIYTCHILPSGDIIIVKRGDQVTEYDIYYIYNTVIHIILLQSILETKKHVI